MSHLGISQRYEIYHLEKQGVNYSSIAKSIGVHKSTINTGMILGGENVNVVPFKTKVTIDRRITNKENIKKSFLEIKNFIKKIDHSAKVKFLTGTNPFKSNKSNFYLNLSYFLTLVKNWKYLY